MSVCSINVPPALGPAWAATLIAVQSTGTTAKGVVLIGVSGRLMAKARLVSAFMSDDLEIVDFIEAPHFEPRHRVQRLYVILSGLRPAESSPMLVRSFGLQPGDGVTQILQKVFVKVSVQLLTCPFRAGWAVDLHREGGSD